MIVVGIFFLLVIGITVYFNKPKVSGDLPEFFDDAVQADEKQKVPKDHAYPKINEALFDFINENKVSGGVPKDGIPAIDNPKYVSAQKAEQKSYVKDDEIVFGIAYKDKTLAFPQDIMYWHEIANEEVNGEKISVTYCPLTGSVIGYKGKNLGVSGVLYNSNLVLYDRETNSEIPQILGVGVTGDLRGTYLEQFPVIVTDWKHWKTQHPDTRVLSLETGHNRNYDRNPYPGYDDLLRVWFPLAAKSDKFKTKDWVFGIKNNGEFLAVPKEQFKTVQKDKIILGGDEIKLEYDSTFQTMRAYNENEEIPAIQMYWFAWYAYYPETRVWKQ